MIQSFFNNAAFVAILLFWSSCQRPQLPVEQSMLDVEGLQSIFQFFEEEGWGYSRDSYIAEMRVINRSLDAYMLLAIDYENSLTSKYNFNLPLPENVSIDYNYLIKHLKDTIHVVSVDSINGLAVLPIGESGNDRHYVFSPLLATTSKEYFVVVAQLQKPRDPYRYLFILHRNKSIFKVIDYYFDDGPVNYVPPEEDLLEQEYQRLYGQNK